MRSTLEHLDEHLGQPVRSWPVTSSPVQVDVVQFDYRTASFASFATVGLADVGLGSRIGERSQYVEFVIVVHASQAGEEIAQSLVLMAQHFMREGEVPPRGDINSLPSPLVPGSRLRAYLASEPLFLPEEARRWKNPLGGTVQLGWLIPVSDREAEFSLEHGHSKLSEAIEGSTVDVFDHLRSDDAIDG